MKKQTTPTDWEKLFDKEWYVGGSPQPSIIKAFIRELLASQRKELIAEIREKLRKERAWMERVHKTSPDDKFQDGGILGMQLAIDVLTSLSEKEGR